MNLELKPGRRSADHVLIGLVGPSGSGKTLSALLLARGLISNGGRIVVIDTEGAHGRALQYAPPGENTFDFLHAKLDQPYTADRFREAFLQAEKAAKGGCVILDSCSAEHEDQGGALEQHAEFTRGQDSKNMIAWAKIRPAQRRWVSAVTRASCHVICCFRAEDKTGVGPGNKPVHLGWQAVGWKRWPYELQISLLLSIHRKGVPIIDGFEWGKLPLNMRDLVPTDLPLSEQTGKNLAAWLAGGDARPQNRQQAPEHRAPVQNGGHHSSFEIEIEDPAQEAPPPRTQPHEPAESRADPAAETVAGQRDLTPEEIKEREVVGELREWTKAKVEQRGKEIAAVLRDHGGSVANLSHAWEMAKDEIMSMPPGAQKGLRKVYDDEYAKLESGEDGDWREGEGRVEDERAGELL